MCSNQLLFFSPRQAKYWVRRNRSLFRISIFILILCVILYKENINFSKRMLLYAVILFAYVACFNINKRKEIKVILIKLKFLYEIIFPNSLLPSILCVIYTSFAILFRRINSNNFTLMLKR